MCWVALRIFTGMVRTVPAMVCCEAGHPANLERVLDNCKNRVYTSVGELADLLGLRPRRPPSS